MTDLNEKALEAAALALISPGTSGNLQMDIRSAARRCVQSYLSALVQDEATVERVARAMADYLGDSLWDDYEGQARAALSALGKGGAGP